ncbi:MAG: STT3 domain-containing protein [Candidatus Thalassarchaeaceae archaeon]|nr:STT3 domain-containing protein [Candidatus Thalassarchaeaceae archaeon]
MDEKNETETSSNPLHGLLAIPVTIAIMLAMMVGATWNYVDYEASEWNTLLMMTVVLLAGGLLGKAPRIIFEPVGTRPSLVSLGFAIVIGAVGLLHIYDGAALLGLVFTITAIGVHIFDRANRHEEEIILVGIVAGFLYAIQVAAAGHAWSSEGTLGGYYSLIDIDRSVTAYLFFTWWVLSIVTGALIALAMRGRLQNPGQGSWFRDLPEMVGKECIPLLSALFVWAAAHGFSLWHLHSLENPDAIFLGEQIGFFWAFLTGIVALFVAYCWAEHWRTLAGLVGINWILYSIGGWQDMGLFGLSGYNFLTGSLGTLTWFAIFFWLNSVVLWAGFTGKLLKGSERRTAGMAAKWWSKHWYGITVGGALLAALVVRTLWNVIPAMNANGTGEWDMTGGSDPWYMKRAIDYILAQNSHFIIDMDRSYPVGSINPRPPLFSWSLALGGKILDPFLAGDVYDAAWWSIAAMPAIYGALTILPIAATCRRFFGAGAGAISAWLMALMPGHVSHSTFALADHDAFVILFMSLGFYFWLCAVDTVGNDKLLPDSHWNPTHLFSGIKASFRKHAQAMSYAILAGVSFATVALGWKGFVYGLAIIYAAFFVQTALNLLRRRDSMPLTSAAIVMMLVTFLLPLPFYGNMELNLIWDASGFQPMFYILGFTIINGWVVTAFRDKPWLMVIVMGGGLFGFLLFSLYLLQMLDIYNGWDVLFTGGYYFSKNKVFGTIAEAQAPSRGQLFANFGPLVFIFALGMGLIALWRGLRHRKEIDLVLSVWILIAAYMAWSAGRFMFNATPIMAIMGSASIAGLWRWCGTKEFVKTWRRLGVSGSGARLRSTIGASRKHPAVPAILMVMLMLFSQHAVYGLDSGIPRGESGEKELDNTIHNILPDVLRAELFGWSVFDGSPYVDYGVGEDSTSRCQSTQNQCWYMGTFGPGFNGRYWNQAYDWLEHQDSDQSFSQRPAFVSWWDYGFQALAQGQHPTVADNFQSGIPAAGNMLLADGEHDTLALFIMTLAEGDMRHESMDDPDDDDGERFTAEFGNILRSHLPNEASWDEWLAVTQLENGAAVADRAYSVIGSADDVVLAEGHEIQSDGTMESATSYRLYENRELIGIYDTLEEAKAGFDLNSKVDWDADGFSDSATHYIIGDYWYTNDLVDDFGDVSTSLHRQNARFAFARQVLITALSMEEMVSLYHDLTALEYEVASFESGPGETVVRNNDIRYFAVDNRLYPIGGYQYAEQGLHSGNPTGIFYAPTTLSGLDPDNYLQTVYITQRGDRPEQEMTGLEFEEQYVNDILASQSGTGGDIIELVDVRVDHQESFFNTMISRTYVGYGSTSLGLDSTNERIAQPAQHLDARYYIGTPDTPLTYAKPLPGAMMPHFALANWYVPGATQNELLSANTGVKILKYYSGATLEGDVNLGDVGIVPNAKILIERDAFSGEDDVDSDERTYWIPVTTTVADENGHYSVRVPSGKIRISAFIGDSDLTAARDTMRQADQQIANSWGDDLVIESNQDRQVNPITGILANVSGSIWLGESTIVVNGEDGHSNGVAVLNSDVNVEASGASGTIFWEGEGDFGEQPLANMELRISNIWDETTQNPYIIRTSTGEVEGERQFGPSATGEVTFTGSGTMISEGTVTATDFTGNFTRAILNGHSFTGEGIIDGRGTFVGTIEDATSFTCINGTMPENATYCNLDSNVTDSYLIDGHVEGASGRFTANGTAQFTTALYRETIIGAGVFVVDTSDESLTSYGTINGTGVFQGTGQFSGDMVSPGSFHLVDAIPGKYHVAVLFENGEEAVLHMPLEVPLSKESPAAKNIELTLLGTWIQGEANSMGGDAITGRVNLVNSETPDEDASAPCGEVAWAPCYVETSADGGFGIGPVLEGEYVVTMDMDQDGFDEYRSSPIIVTSDNAGNVTPDNINMIPPMYDVEFTVKGPNGNLVSGMNITFTNQFAPISFDARDNGNGSYNIELATGEWVATSLLDEDSILYEEILIEQDDIIDLELNYVESEWVNGTVMYEPVDDKTTELEPYKNQMVMVQWGGITEDTMTDDNGSFSFQLPLGAEVNLTIHVIVGNRMIGKHFIVGEENLSEPLMPQTTWGASGDLFLYEVGRRYDSQVPGYGQHPFVLETYHEETGVTWHWPVDQNGHFVSYVIDNETSNWVFGINEDILNVEPLNYSVAGADNNTLTLIASPDAVNVTLTPFIDHSLDGNVSNGTTQAIEFTLIQIGSMTGYTVNVSADDAGWDNGSISMNLQAGDWIFETPTLDPSDPANSTSFSTIISVLDDGDESFGAVNTDSKFSVLIGNESTEVNIGFIPQWHTSILLENQLNVPLENWTVDFEEIDGVRSFSLLTDSNGTIVDYIAEGEWFVIVDRFIQDDGTEDNVPQEYRGSIIIDSEQSGIVWTTTESAQFNLSISESGSNTTLSGFTLIANSDDRPGDVFEVGPSDENGLIEARLMPGDWTLSLNRTDSNLRWILENYTITVSAGAAANADVNITLDKWVEIAGNLFWDLNNDDLWNLGEGIADANVTVTGPSFGPVNLTSNNMGTWSVFVPTSDNYTVNAIREGYSPSSTVIEVGYTANSSDMEMDAGVVTIGGMITHSLPSEWNLISDDVEITLLPESGLARTSLSATKVLDNGTWNGTWSAVVEPGAWVLHVTYDGNEGKFAAMELVNAEIADGGELNVTLSTASILNLETSWIDFDGVERNLSDTTLISNPTDLIMANGLTMRWNETVDANGSLNLLLPAGDYSVEASFTTMEQAMEMSYSGGLSAEVVGGGIESPDYVVNFNRRFDHSVMFAIGDNFVNVTQSTTDTDEFTIIAGENEEFLIADIPVIVNYTGNQAVDEFTVSALINGGDAEYWTVVFYNGTNETGAEVWETTRTYTMGIGSPANETTVMMRIVPANQTLAQSYSFGHSLKIKMTNSDGSHSEYELTLRVPQTYGFEVVSDITEEFGIIPGSDDQYEFIIKNTGNGDDQYFFEIGAIPDTPELEGWSVQGAVSVPVGASSAQMYSLNIHSPTNAPDTSFSVWITVTSKDNTSYAPFEIKIKTALPDLSIDDWGVVDTSKSGFAAADSDNTFFVNVENSGDVDAANVVVEILNASGDVVGSKALPVAKGVTESFEIIVNTAPYGIGSENFVLHINTTGFQVVSEPDDVTFAVNIQKEAPEEASFILGIVVLLLFVGIIYMFVKFSGRRGAQPF